MRFIPAENIAGWALVGLIAATPAPAFATEWFVAPGGSGPGTSTAPFGRIQAGIDAALPGDTVTVRAGTYAETLQTVRNGTVSSPITLRSAGLRGSAIVTIKGKVLEASHAYFTVEGLVFDGQYGDADLVHAGSTADYLVLRNTEVRRATRDCVDLAAPDGVLIEQSLIHHCLNAANGRTDAHGIVAGAVHNLTIRDTEVHTFSGDGFQADPSRAAPGWDNVTIERCKFWLAPLAQPENGFAAGTVTGESGVDTKTATTAPRARLTITDTTAWGFRGGLITNMAAFNLKENIDATLNRITVYNSEIAFRARGITSTTPVGAWIVIKNSLAYDVTTGVRYENNLENFRLWNTTFGRAVTKGFQDSSFTGAPLDVRNLLLLGTQLPAEAAGATNMASSSGAFVNSAADDYHLAATSGAIDAGVTIAGVVTDRDATTRPQGAGFDIGAYEYCGADCGSPGPVPASPELVLYASRAGAIFGAWTIVADATAAGGSRLAHPDQGASKISKALASPVHYFELTFAADAGKPYRLWIRGKAQSNLARNDSVFVQFSGSITASGSPIYRIGTTSATTIALEDCTGCGVAGWGWQDDGYGAGVLGPAITFATSGQQTVRFQTREDGLSIDQVVISPSVNLTKSPGAVKNDTTILAAKP